MKSRQRKPARKSTPRRARSAGTTRWANSRSVNQVRAVVVVFTFTIVMLPAPAAPQPPSSRGPENAGSTSAPNPNQVDLLAEVSVDDHGEGGNATIRGTVTNVGDSSPRATALVRVEGGGARPSRSVTIPPLRPGESHALSLNLPIPAGLSRVVLEADPDDQIREESEANNRASAWIERPFPGKISAGEPATVEDSNGTGRPAQSIDIKENATRVTVRVVPAQGQKVRLAIDQDWLRSRLGGVALEDGRFEEVRREGRMYFVTDFFDAAQTFEFVPFEPSTRPLFSRGNLESILLDERPMQITLQSVPGEPRPAQTFTNANGTYNVPSTPSQALTLSFDDGDSQGQPIWFARKWLASYGITDAVFRTEDGRTIPAVDHASHVLVFVAHFSQIHAFNSSADNFQLVSDQTWSFVGWESAGGGRIKVVADRRDALDETMIRDFIPAGQFTLSAKFGVATRGHWQAAYPLSIGNQTERQQPDPNDNWFTPKSLGFYYDSRDDNVAVTDPEGYPLIRAYFANATGGRNDLWTWRSSAETGWTVQLKIIATGANYTLQLLTWIFATGGPIKKISV